LGKILSAEAGQQKEKIQSGNRGTERKNGGCHSWCENSEERRSEDENAFVFALTFCPFCSG
jgi:hypothetical protein